jgi:hypothetical protein
MMRLRIAAIGLSNSLTTPYETAAASKNVAISNEKNIRSPYARSP